MPSLVREYLKHKAVNSAISTINAVSNDSISNEFEGYKINIVCITSEHVNYSLTQQSKTVSTITKIYFL